MSKRQKKSFLWNYFSVKDSANKTALCDLCGQILNYKTTISNLKKHIERRHPTVNLTSDSSTTSKKSKSDLDVNQPAPSSSSANANNENEQNNEPSQIADKSPIELNQNIGIQPKPPQSNQTKIQSYISAPKKITESHKKKLDKLLLQLFIRDYQPFSIVQDESFINFVKGLNPSYQLPSRRTITRAMIPAEYERCLNQLRESLTHVSSLCITTDLWTSMNMESFLGVTAHYLTNNFELKSVLLECSLLTGPHDKDNIANALWTTLDKFHLHEKVLVVVSDNASNMKAAIDVLHLKHFGCFAHTINLICQEALGLQETATLIGNVKTIVTYFKRSTLGQEKLNNAQLNHNMAVPKKLLQEVLTRWNSTYYMLERVVELQDPLKTTIGLLNKGLPILTEDEWQICKDLTVVLEPLEEITRKISGEKYVTASIVIPLTNGLKSVYDKMSKENFGPQVKDVILKVKEGLNKRFVNVEKSKSLGLATFLDPRFKLAPFTNESDAKAIKDHCQSLMAQIWSLKRSEAEKRYEEDRNHSATPEPEREKKKYSVWENLESKIASSKTSGSKTSAAIIEVNRYLEEGYLERKKDPLQWWDENKIYYPLMAAVAKDKLCMVGSSVPCERLFSKAGNIITERRSRLKPHVVEKMLFLNANYGNSV